MGGYDVGLLERTLAAEFFCVENGKVKRDTKID